MEEAAQGGGGPSAGGAGEGPHGGAPADDGDDPDDPAAAAARRDRGAGDHGCAHYRRRCRLVAPCCAGAVFWCRHCHNDACDANEADPSRRHTLDRRAVAEVVCALCDARQPAAPRCASCGVSFGRYYCAACKFWDDDLSKGQWHCRQCGICRVGFEANFFHCATCSSCLSLALRDGHVCVHESMKRACPVCFEYLFDSVRPISVLPRCGHVLHSDCFSRLLAHGALTCPLCLRVAVAPAQRDALWARMDDAVRETAMPAEYEGVRVAVLCNDCGARSAAPFHVVGHKCGACGGYNTRRV